MQSIGLMRDYALLSPLQMMDMPLKWFIGMVLSSPKGHGHYVLTSSSPTGPFTLATGNLGHSIDGHVFIDDNGSWTFYSAGGDGIHAAPMSSPTSIGSDIVLGGTQMGGQWTEGATVIKRNGTYYLTATGNHVLSPGYRVNAFSNTTGPL